MSDNIYYDDDTGLFFDPDTGEYYYDEEGSESAFPSD